MRLDAELHDLRRATVIVTVPRVLRLRVWIALRIMQFACWVATLNYREER